MSQSDNSDTTNLTLGDSRFTEDVTEMMTFYIFTVLWKQRYMWWTIDEMEAIAGSFTCLALPDERMCADDSWNQKNLILLRDESQAEERLQTSTLAAGIL